MKKRETEMKKIITILMSILMCIFLAACDFSFDGQKGEIVNKLTTLSAPTINETISDNMVRWSSVANADAYVVSMNGVEARTTDLSYPISGLIDVSCEVSIKVMAKGNGILYSDSEWSTTLVYTYTKNSTSNDSQKLDTPRFNYDKSKNIITWEPVAGAAGYYVSVNNGPQESVATTSYYPNVKENDIFVFKMKASAGENQSQYLDSDWTFEQSFTFEPYVVTKCTAEINNNMETDYTCTRDENYYYYIFKLGRIYDVILNPVYDSYGGAIGDVTLEKTIKTIKTEEVATEIKKFVQNETHSDYSISEELSYSFSKTMKASISDSISASVNKSNSITASIKANQSWGYSSLASLALNYSQAVKTTEEEVYTIRYTFKKDDAHGKYIVAGENCILDVFSIVTVDPFTEEYSVVNLALINNSSSISSPIFLGNDVHEYKNEPEVKLDLKEIKIETILKNKPTQDVNGIDIPAGNKLNPIELNNENFSSIRNGLDKHYILVEDIDLSSYSPWLPIGCDRSGSAAEYTAFTGSLNGNFFTIKGLQSNVPSGGADKCSYKGLFALLDEGACIENLFIECNFNYIHESFEDAISKKMVGVVAGESKDAEIKNVSVSGRINIDKDKGYTGGEYYVGGIVGCSSGKTNIICCSVDMDIFVKNNSTVVGGIVGGVFEDGLNISHCYSTGSLEAVGQDWYGSHTFSRVGGIVGTSKEYSISISDCLVYTNKPLNAHGASDDTVFGINQDSNKIGAIIGKTNNKNNNTICNNAYLLGTAQKTCGEGAINDARVFEKNEIHDDSFSKSGFSGLAFCEFKNKADLVESDCRNCWVYSSDGYPKLWFQAKVLW